ncbi:NADH-quinone oxidoreductase subunit NuoE [Chloroflexota bacterium]
MRIAEVKDVPGIDTQNQEGTVKDRVDEILVSYRGEKAELIPLLQQAQHIFGYLPEAALSRIAAFVDVPESTIFGIATFYSQFRFVPAGRNVIKVCRGTGCYVKGAPRMLDELEKELGIKAGETTSDLEYSLETVACFGACALAPVMVVNDDVYGRMTKDKVRQVLDKYLEEPQNNGK